jgi:hypothetical protein
MPAVRPIAAQRPAKLSGLRTSIARRSQFRASALRRDLRRFGAALPRFDVAPEVPAQPSMGLSDLKLFAHTFAAGFLFVTVFLA